MVTTTRPTDMTCWHGGWLHQPYLGAWTTTAAATGPAVARRMATGELMYAYVRAGVVSVRVTSVGAYIRVHERFFAVRVRVAAVGALTLRVRAPVRS